MSGYTPVFGSVFTGSLCGQYPDTAAWLFLLAMADRHGVVDRTPQYIASVTGMSLHDLMGCLERFMQPDPMSRTSEYEGRRLELIDPSRTWGWRILNFRAYRERARLMAKNAEATANGQDAARKRQARQLGAGEAVRRCPPVSAGGHPSDKTRQDKTSPSGSKEIAPTGAGTALAVLNDQKRAAFQQVQAAYPAGSYPDSDWERAQRNIARLIERQMAGVAELVEAARAYCRQQQAAGEIGGRFIKWPSRFFDPSEQYFRGPFMPPLSQAERKVDRTIEAGRDFINENGHGAS